MKGPPCQAADEIDARTRPVVTRGSRRKCDADPDDRQEPAVALAEAWRAIEYCQRQMTLASRQIEALSIANARLESKLMDLSRREAQARTLAYFDALTGLPNRRLLEDRFTQAIAQGTRRHKRVVLLLLDLDDFKGINDRLGHGAGDEVLRAVAKRLVATIRSADTACRYGGDEFVVMLPEVEVAASSARVLKKLQRALSAPYVIDGFEVRMTVSAGSVDCPGEGESPVAAVDLLKRADAALYRAKSARRNVSITKLAKHAAAGQRPGRAPASQRKMHNPMSSPELALRKVGSGGRGN